MFSPPSNPHPARTFYGAETHWEKRKAKHIKKRTCITYVVGKHIILAGDVFRKEVPAVIPDLKDRWDDIMDRHGVAPRSNLV